MTRIGLVGLGHWGQNWARTLASQGRLAAVCDSQPGLAAQYAARYEGVGRCDTLSDLLSAGVEAVVLCTPPASHEAMALEAIAAGKHVLVEKPLATDTASAARIVDAAHEAGVILMVGHVFLYNPGTQGLIRAIHDGEIGDLRRIECTRHNLGIVRNDVDALWNLAPHDVSIAVAAAGRLPTKVRGWGHAWLQTGIADHVEAELEFPGGVRSHISVSWLSAHKKREVVAIGERGMIVHDDTRTDEPVRLFRQGYAVDDGVPRRFEHGTYTLATQRDSPLSLESDAFVHAIETGEAPVADGRNGVDVVRVLEAISESIRRDGAAVDVDGARRA